MKKYKTLIIASIVGIAAFIAGMNVSAYFCVKQIETIQDALTG